ncbi:MAG: ABC transporter permease [Ramlibacter sp.]
MRCRAAASVARLLGLMVFGLPLMVVVAAPLVFPGDPRDANAAAFLAPSLRHPMGTDDLGRDLLASLAHGGQASLLSGGLVALGATTLAIVLGVIAGLAGGTVDRVIVRLMDLSQIVPRFFLALLASALLGPSWVTLAVILALTGWATLARQIRAEARSLRHAAFVEAALLLGASRTSVAVRHLTPLMLPLALPHIPLILCSALLIEAGLSFLGAGDPNRLSWGLLVQTGQAHSLRAWWLMLFPGLAFALTSVGLTLLALDRDDAQNADRLAATE